MSNTRRVWTRDELILALALYFRINLSNSNPKDPKMIRVAEIIGRTPAAVHAKVNNLKCFDPELRKRGLVGLQHTGKLDKVIWDEFSEDIAKLAEQATLIETKMGGLANSPDMLTKEGGETVRETRQRINQGFFRETVLSAYNESCCITGINVPQVLVASHIKPWAKCSPKEQLNPHNGLCLNALHDRAFDRGLITVDSSFKIRVSSMIKETENVRVHKWLTAFEGQNIQLPEKFMPNINFLSWHEQNVFVA